MLLIDLVNNDRYSIVEIYVNFCWCGRCVEVLEIVVFFLWNCNSFVGCMCVVMSDILFFKLIYNKSIPWEYIGWIVLLNITVRRCIVNDFVLVNSIWGHTSPERVDIFDPWEL